MACQGQQVQPGCCCTVAFEGPIAMMVGALPNGCLARTSLLNALTSPNIDTLSNYKLLFLGPPGYSTPPFGVCTYPYYQYTTAQNLKIKAWVEAGGRLFCAASYPANFDCSTWPTTTPTYDRLNTFLGFLGTSMQMTQNAPLGCVVGCTPTSSVPQAQPIVAGLANGVVTGSVAGVVGQVTGGTELVRINASGAPCFSTNCFLAAEQIGSGIVFSCIGQITNATSCGLPNKNCEFFQRMCSWPVADMLV